LSAAHQLEIAMNARDIAQTRDHGTQKEENSESGEAIVHELVDLGDVKAETRGFAGGALDLPISAGHY
jgi:hypothetical protein